MVPMVNLRGLIVNSIVGIVVLFISNAVGIGVQISLVPILICAVFGIPGAILVILLSLLDIAFVAAVFPSLPV